MRWVKKVAAITVVSLTVSSFAAFIPAGVRHAQAAAGSRLELHDDTLSVSVNTSNGRFAARTTGGDPGRTTDQNQPLIYEKEVPETSFTSFRIDGEEVIYGHTYATASGQQGVFVQQPHTEGTKLVSVWKYKDVEITQTIGLVPKGDSSLPAGNSLVTYKVDNKSNRIVSLGTRILLDVTAGSNDGALLMTPGEMSPVIGEREFKNENVPLYWQALDDFEHPTVNAYGILYGFGETKPSRVVFGHWSGLSATKWNYQPNPWVDYASKDNTYGTADSAVAIYWDEVKLAGGSAASFSTLVGMGEMEQRQSLLSNMAVSVSAPKKVIAGGSSTAPFEVSAEIDNGLAQSVEQKEVLVELSYPGNAVPSGGDQTKIYVPAVAKGGRLSFKWKFTPTDVGSVNVYEFKVRVTVGDAQSPGVMRKEQSAYVVVMPGFQAPPKIQYTAVAPTKMYRLESFRKASIYGSNFNYLKDDPSKWSVYLQDQAGNKTTIASNRVTVEADNLITVILPAGLALGSYGIGIFHQLGDGMYRPNAIEITDDVKVMKRGFGTLIITKKDTLKTRTDIGGQYTFTENFIHFSIGNHIPTIPADQQEVLRIQGNIQDMGNDTYSVVPDPSNAVYIGNVLKLTVSDYDADMPGEIVVRRVEYKYEDSIVYDKAMQVTVSGNDKSRIYLNKVMGATASPLIWKQAFDFNVNNIAIKNPNIFGFSDVANAMVGPYLLGIKQVKVVYDPDEKKYAAEFKGSLDILTILKTLYQFFGANNDFRKNLFYAEINVDKFRVYEDGQIKFALEAGIGLPQLKIGPYMTDYVRSDTTGGVEARLRIDTIQNLYSIYANLSLPNLESFPTGSGGSYNRSSRIRGKIGVFTVPTPGGMIPFPDEISAEYADNLGIISIPQIPVAINQIGGEIKGLHTFRDSIAKGIYPDFTGSFWFGITDTKSPLLFGRRALSARDVKLSIGSREASLSGTGYLYVLPVADFKGKLMFYPVTGASLEGKVSLLDVIVGKAGVELSYNHSSDQFYFGGYVRGYVQVPGYSPIFPGLKFADASASINTNFVQAYAKALNTFPVGVRYTWATQQVQFYNPNMEEFVAAPMNVAGEGDELKVGTNLYAIEVSKVAGRVSALGSTPTNAYSFVAAGNDALLVQAKYGKGQSIHLAITDPDGNPVALVEEGDGQNVFKSVYHDNATNADQDYVAVTIPVEASKPGTWHITSDVPAEFEVYGAKPLPEVETLGASQQAGESEVTVDLTLSKAPVNKTTADIFLESTDPGKHFITRLLADAAIDGSSKTLDATLPNHIENGSYRIVAELKNYDTDGTTLLQNYHKESADFQVVNPMVPPKPANVTATAVGRGAAKVEWDAVEAPNITGYNVFAVDENGDTAEGTSPLFVPYEAGKQRYAANIVGWQTGRDYRIVVQAVREEGGQTSGDDYSGNPHAGHVKIAEPDKDGRYVVNWDKIDGVDKYVILLKDADGKTSAIPYFSADASLARLEAVLRGLPAGMNYEVAVKGIKEPDLQAKHVTATDEPDGVKKISWDKVDANGIVSYTIVGKPQGDGDPVVREYVVPASGQPDTYTDIQVDGFAGGEQYDITVVANVQSNTPKPYLGAWSDIASLTLPIPKPPQFDIRLQPSDLSGNGTIKVDYDDKGTPYFRTNTTNVRLNFTSDSAVRSEVAVNSAKYGDKIEPTEQAGASWTTDLALEEGINDVDITTYNKDGDADERTYRIIVKNRVPMLAVEDAVYSQDDGLFHLSGMTDSGATVTIDGNQVAVDGDGHFSYQFAPPSRQMFDLRVVAADTFGSENVYVQQVVNPAVPEISRIAIAMDNTMAAGGMQPLKLLAYDEQGNAVQLPNDNVEWKVEAGDQNAEIAGGYLKGLKQGQAVVSAGYRVNEKFAWTDYTVIDLDPSGEIVTQSATLSSIDTSSGSLVPSFAPGAYSYQLDVPHHLGAIQIKPTAGHDNTTIKVNGVTVTNGVYGSSIPLTEDGGTITVDVETSGMFSSQYTIQVNRMAATDQESVTADTASLAIGYAAGDSAAGVTQNVYLPASGANKTTINWSSDRPDVIDSTGKVARPNDVDANVTLTATIAKGSVAETKTFVVTVKALTDAEAVAIDAAQLAIGYAAGDSAASVMQNVYLPAGGASGTTIAWVSNMPDAIDAAGNVTRPDDVDANVTLTATIAKGAVTDTKTFDVHVVKVAQSDAEAVQWDLEHLDKRIGYAVGDSVYSVTQNVYLPGSGPNGTTIVWSSNEPTVLDNTGKVTTPKIADTTVTLTATVTRGQASDTKTFALQVKINDEDAVALAMAQLAIGYAAGDSAASVTQNVYLPTGGPNGTTIVWSSNRPAAIEPTGNVTRPGDADAAVTLTATIRRGTVAGTRTFDLNVLKRGQTDGEAVALDKASLAIGYAPGDSAASVTQNVHLPTSGANGTTIVWSSDRPAVIDAAGKVARPSDADAAVILTAAVQRGSATDAKTFPLRVKRLEQAVTVEPDPPVQQQQQPSGDKGKEINPSTGGLVTGEGLEIEFPAGVFPEKFNTSVAVVTDADKLPLPDNKQRVSNVYEIKKDKPGNFSKPVTITLAFDRSKMNPSTETAAPYWLNEQTGEWIPLDGVAVDSAKGTVSGSVTHFTKFAVLAAPLPKPAANDPQPQPDVGKPQPDTGKPKPHFGDIGGHWAETSIAAMAELGVVDGYPDGTFKPERQVSRAEFVQLLVRATGMAGKPGKTFDDTANHWAKDAIAAASGVGIVEGFDEKTFGPDEPITRQQMAVMVARALKLAPAGSTTAAFADSADIAAWALPSVTAAAQRGLFIGYEDGTFRPQGRATRAETVELLGRALNFMHK